MEQFFQEVLLSVVVAALLLYFLFQLSCPEQQVPPPVGAKDEGSEWDWIGVEESEAGASFRAAVKYANSGEGREAIGRKVSGEDRLRLYALCKAATEGPCFKRPPIAINLNARAKWNAWQKLGNMTPEVAMEQYVGLLSELIPQWNSAVEQKKDADGDGSQGTIAADNKHSAAERWRLNF